MRARASPSSASKSALSMGSPRQMGRGVANCADFPRFRKVDAGPVVDEALTSASCRRTSLSGVRHRTAPWTLSRHRAPVSLTPQPSAPLQPGAVINALVLQLLDEGQVRLAVANTLIDVMSQVPLVPGQNVRLAVEGTPAEPRLVLVEPGPCGRSAA